MVGSTSGIGKDFADHLASQKMNVLVISRTEERLQEQAQALQNKHGVSAAYLAYDFTKTGKPREEFYQKLKVQLQKMDQDGGVGLLVNNGKNTSDGVLFTLCLFLIIPTSSII